MLPSRTKPMLSGVSLNPLNPNSSLMVMTISGDDYFVDQPIKVSSSSKLNQSSDVTIRAAPGARVRITGSTPLGPPLDHISGAANALLVPEARGHVLAYALDPATERRVLAEPPTSPRSLLQQASC